MQQKASLPGAFLSPLRKEPKENQGADTGNFVPLLSAPLDPGVRPGGGGVYVGWQNLKAVAARIGLAHEQLRLSPLV